MMIIVTVCTCKSAVYMYSPRQYRRKDTCIMLRWNFRKKWFMVHTYQFGICIELCFLGILNTVFNSSISPHVRRWYSCFVHTVPIVPTLYSILLKLSNIKQSTTADWKWTQTVSTRRIPLFSFQLTMNKTVIRSVIPHAILLCLLHKDNSKGMHLYLKVCTHTHRNTKNKIVQITRAYLNSSSNN